MLHSFAGEPIRSIVLAVAGVLVGVIVSFIYMWPFALLTLATIPFMAFGAEMEVRADDSLFYVAIFSLLH